MLKPEWQPRLLHHLPAGATRVTGGPRPGPLFYSDSAVPLSGAELSDRPRLLPFRFPRANGVSA